MRAATRRSTIRCIALIERPNPLDTSVSFIEAICANLLLYGNAYIESVLIDEELRELYALRPDRMSIEAGRNGWPAAFIYRALGQEARYEMRGEGVEPILHIKFFNPLDDYYGFPPLAAAQVALDTHNAASFWNKALLDNSARPSGALVYAGPEGAHLTDEQFSRLKEELEENFSGATNAGRPLLLEGGLDWKALSLSPKDMDFTEFEGGRRARDRARLRRAAAAAGSARRQHVQQLRRGQSRLLAPDRSAARRARAEELSGLAAAGLRTLSPRL